MFPSLPSVRAYRCYDWRYATRGPWVVTRPECLWRKRQLFRCATAAATGLAVVDSVWIVQAMRACAFACACIWLYVVCLLSSTLFSISSLSFSLSSRALSLSLFWLQHHDMGSCTRCLTLKHCRKGKAHSIRNAPPPTRRFLLSRIPAPEERYSYENSRALTPKTPGAVTKKPKGKTRCRC